jgi:hypothetical protein
MSGGPGVQYSPDGRWWWDGSQWRPVPPQTPPPEQAPQPAAAQSYQPDVPRVSQAPRSRRGVPIAIIVLLVVFAFLLVAGGVGLFLALRNVANRLASPANPPMPTVSLPVGSPGTALALPPIHGVTASQVTAALGSKGYSCTESRQVAGTWIAACSRTDDQTGVFYEVSVGGSDSTSVGLISAGMISTRGSPPTRAQASQFFSTVVGTVGQGSEASQANGWIQQNLDAGGDATAGDLRIHLGRPGSNYLLVITSRTGG